MKEINPGQVLMQDDEIAGMMRALGHPVRLNILRIMAKRQQDCCCADVTQCLPLAQSTVSQHIKVLFEAGLIERRPEGTRNCYIVVSSKFAALEKAFSGLNAGLLELSTANLHLENES